MGELELESELTLLRPAVMKGFMNRNSIKLQPSHAISACMAVRTHDVYVYIQTCWCRMLEREYSGTSLRRTPSGPMANWLFCIERCP